jgi:transketolase
MHGEAMGNDEIAATRANLGWKWPPYEIPGDIRAAWDMREKGARAEKEWSTRFAAYKTEFPALAAEFKRRMAGDLPTGFGD